MTLLIQQAKFELYQKQTLNLPHFAIEPRQYWVVVGSNGSGKSAFALALQNELPLQEGEYRNTFKCVQSFSFEKQREILEATLKNLNNDDTDPDFFGQTARETILNGSTELTFCEQIAEKLGITYLLDRFFIKLSTGETRKVLLAQALLQKPDLLILDEPFEGLDHQSVQDWMTMLNELKKECAIVLIVNRLADIPAEATHLAMLENLELVLEGERQSIEQQSIYQQLVYAEQSVDVALPEPASPLLKLPENQPHFELKNVTVQYGDKVILDHLNWVVQSNQNWWIKGPNGAGKTTTMKIMAGLVQADGGSVKISGIDALKESRMIKRIIGYMPDFFGVYDNLKVMEYMEFYASIYGITGSKAEKLCRKLMELVDLTDKSEFLVDELSRGMKQRLCLARCLVHDPKLLILDEPASGLDPRARHGIQKIIKRLKEEKKTIIISSHILQELSELCTSVGVIDHGKMVVRGTVDEIMLHLNASNPIQIHINDGVQKAINVLKNESKVKNISISDKDISIGFLGSEDDEAELLKKLISNDIKLSSFARQSGNIEEIFMKATEKREVLGDEDKDKSGIW